jgi:hypothetical protein
LDFALFKLAAKALRNCAKLCVDVFQIDNLLLAGALRQCSFICHSRGNEQQDCEEAGNPEFQEVKRVLTAVNQRQNEPAILGLFSPFIPGFVRTSPNDFNGVQKLVQLFGWGLNHLV